MEKETSAEERKIELVRQVGLEWLKHAFGEDTKPMAKMVAGLHLETCTFNPVNLKATLVHIAQNRASMEKQLQKTTMAPDPRKNALDNLFGPSAPVGGKSSSNKDGLKPLGVDGLGAGAWLAQRGCEDGCEKGCESLVKGVVRVVKGLLVDQAQSEGDFLLLFFLPKAGGNMSRQERSL